MFPDLEFLQTSITTISQDYKVRYGKNSDLVIELSSWIKFNLVERDIKDLGIDIQFGVINKNDFCNLIWGLTTKYFMEVEWNGLFLGVFENKNNLKTVPTFYLAHKNTLTQESKDEIVSKLKVSIEEINSTIAILRRI